MLIHLDHVGIVAATIGDAQQVLVEQMGMELDVSRSPLPDGTYFAPERTNNYFFNVAEGQTQIEVLIPADTTSGTAKFLARRGPGLHHLGYAVANVGEEADRLAAAGLVQIDLGAAPDRLQAAFFQPRSAGGILTEIVPLRS